MAQVSWWMGDKKLEDGDRFNISKDLTGVCRLTIKSGEASDSGQVTCRLEKQEDKTTTTLTVVGENNFPHKSPTFFFLGVSVCILFPEVESYNK
jgi:hypothetical protein